MTLAPYAPAVALRTPAMPSIRWVSCATRRNGPERLSLGPQRDHEIVAKRLVEARPAEIGGSGGTGWGFEG